MAKKALISGFCAQSLHEGTKPQTRDGKPKAICVMWQTCTCSCHKRVTEMYESLGLPREEAMQNPDYSEYARAERAKFVMPDPVMARLTDSFNSGDTFPHPEDEGPYTGQQDPALGTSPDIAPPPVVPSFGPTPTGRRARGQLEVDVLKVCQDFMLDVYEWEICTPKLVAEAIGKKYAVEPPSTGAVDAVWDRWEALGFAKRDRKPSRFVGFTDNSSYSYLEGLKLSKKRQHRRQIAEQRRGIPRPPKARSKR